MKEHSISDQSQGRWCGIERLVSEGVVEEGERLTMVTLERVKPTEPAILEMVRNHYSHRDNVKQRPRTEKTSKTWWSNARLVVFSDLERTLVFAWQWPKDGIRKDGQNGYNNTLFHRSERCPYQASDIVLAAERAVVDHWGENRAYTYVDPEKIQSVNPGYCYKVVGWKQVKISGTGKPLLEKLLTRDQPPCATWSSPPCSSSSVWVGLSTRRCGSV